MGFFDRMYYGKAGKRDYSEMDMPKNRVSLFFMVLKDHIFDLVKVNLMQVIFWIPFCCGRISTLRRCRASIPKRCSQGQTAQRT